MPPLPADPIADGLAEFGKRLRAGIVTAEQATRAYLERIAVLDPKLGAFEHVAGERALATARAIDRLRAAGTDLGPLMGVPVAIKDLLAVAGMPTTAGSNLPVDHLAGPEGTFVRRLKQAGAVVLGKVKTIEFALGGHGISEVRGTPWNPWDSKVRRIPGGSSSGSAVAVAAGLCGFAIGTDTGGSVRTPASFCGVFGLKTTAGLWPTDGVFPLSRTLDTIGPLTKSAADAATVFAALAGTPAPAAAPPRGVRLGRPTSYFFDDIQPTVRAAVEGTIAKLEAAGVTVVPVAVPKAAEIATDFGRIGPPELLAVLGRDFFVRERNRMDPDVVARLAPAIDIMADDYIRTLWMHERMSREVNAAFESLDGWIMPTTPLVAAPVADFRNRPDAGEFAKLMARNTRHANFFRLCAITVPVKEPDAPLPAGVQVMCRGGDEARALAIGRLIEEATGPAPRPDLSGFLRATDR